MIKLKLNDPAPLGARITQINGDDVFYYFADDADVVKMEQSRADELLRHQRAQQKQQRKQYMNSATVTTAAGNTYNADETSQQRMARAVIVIDNAETITWTLADNMVAQVTRSELHEALRLAVIAQAAVWTINQSES